MTLLIYLGEKKMKCEYCELAERKTDLIYEDEDVAVAVKDFVVIPGQITIFPKKHFTILELVPDEIIEKCSQLSNKVGIAVFESLGCQGTNIIIQNGTSAGQKVPHFALEVIPRRENDGLNLQWETKQISEDEMETTHLMIKQESDKLVDIGKKKKKEEIKEITKETKSEPITKKEGQDNYLLKSLRKRP
mgnify:CR=1 FL=1